MDDKSLADKAVDIKGKQYVLVSDRVLYFNEKYPNGGITTELISSPDSERIIVKATVWPDGGELQCGPETSGWNSHRKFTGYSQAVIGEGMVNKTAALENAETSAVGRALAFMGIGVIDSVASADEMHKAKPAAKALDPIMKQKLRITDLLKELGEKTRTKEECAEAVERLTDLSLLEINYGTIIDRLTALADERHNK